MITIKETDILFVNSPDAGPNCLCSRCQRPIMFIALRCWPHSGGGEYRFHFACQGFSSDNDARPIEYGHDFFQDTDYDIFPE